MAYTPPDPIGYLHVDDPTGEAANAPGVQEALSRLRAAEGAWRQYAPNASAFDTTDWGQPLKVAFADYQKAIGDFNRSRGGMSDQEWTDLQSYKAEAQKMMNGEGLQKFDDLYKPLERSVNQGAFNLAGSQAADLAKRGLSRSGMQAGSVRDVEQGRATDLASGAAKVTQDLQGQKEATYQSGQQAMSRAQDYEQNRKNLLLAKEQCQSWAQSYNPPPFAQWFDRPGQLAPQSGSGQDSGNGT